MTEIRLEIYSKDYTSADGRTFRGYSIKRNGEWHKLHMGKDCRRLPTNLSKFYIICNVAKDEKGDSYIVGLNDSKKPDEYGKYHFYLHDYVRTEEFEFAEGCSIEGF